MIKNFAQVTLLVALAVAGNAAPAFAQPTNRFHRVTTKAEPSPRATADRENPDAASRDPSLDPTAKQDPAAPKQDAKTARGAAARASTTGSQTRAQTQTQDRESNDVLHPSRRQEAEPVSRPARTASPPRSHNYYPGLRSGVGPSQPVRLTTRPTRTPMNAGGRSMTGGQATSRAAGMPGMAHHR
jgi:hypothetical protein